MKIPCNINRYALLAIVALILCFQFFIFSSRYRQNGPSVYCDGRNIFTDKENIVWTYWDDYNLPFHVSRILYSWKIWNPDVTLIILNERTLKCFMKNDWHDVKSQPLRSDLIRLSVLETYGGTWIDPTVLMMKDIFKEPPKSFQGCYTEHYSTHPRQFPESWFIRAEKHFVVIQKWKALLIKVLTDNKFRFKDLSKKSFIYTPETTASFPAIAKICGRNAQHWSEYLVIYVTYMYLYSTDVMFRETIFNSRMEASESFGYFLQWKYNWNMTTINQVIGAPYGSLPVHSELVESSLIKLSAINLKTSAGNELVHSDRHSFLAAALRLPPTSDLDVERQDFKLVIATYDEDISWSRRYQGLRAIYEKSGKQRYSGESQYDEVVSIPNVGKEAFSYLSYIIHNYDSLPEYVAFSQGGISQEHAWIRKDFGPDMFLNMLREARKNDGCSDPMTAPKDHPDFGYGFNPLNPRDKKYAPKSISLSKDLAPDFRAWMMKIGLPSKYDKLKIYPSAYMVISKRRIQSRSRKYYMDLLPHLNYALDPPEGHYFERSWYYIFNCNVD